MMRPRTVDPLDAPRSSVAVLALAACVPGAGAFLRNVDGQTWAARFDVSVGPTGGPTFRLPVDLQLTFRQQRTGVTANASLAYAAALFRLRTGNIGTLSSEATPRGPNDRARGVTIQPALTDARDDLRARESARVGDRAIRQLL